MNKIAIELNIKVKKKNFNLDKLKIYVIDCETTGLEGVRYGDLVLSIGISEVDIINHTVDPFFNRTIGYDVTEHDDVINKDTWIFKNSSLSLEDIKFAYDDNQDVNNVVAEFNDIMENKWIAMYNKDYDYGKFLRHSPFNLDPSRILPCLMIASTEPCAIPKRWGNEYKWPTLEEAVDILLDNDIKKELAEQENFHDSLYDTFVSGHVMLKLIELGHYNLLSYIDEQ